VSTKMMCVLVAMLGLYSSKQRYAAWTRLQ